ncbi:uncharacterized protein LOC115925167 [Strongylocentrotus purpuratus]|uniref:Death domain-containing protein n=1 Tax=Strongylocentrotus purpuratus TaxID=7668 RepID=A0A7M7T093_STRPU|nr:uncharacterized protein LOC115925167 [Strongylocentrotus purpuratus]
MTGINKETTGQNAPSPNIDEIPSDEQKVTDANILKLARLLPPNLWSPLYVALRIDYSIAKGIRENSREMNEQYIDLLQIWKSASTRTRKDLNAILIQAEAGGFVDKYLDSV